MNSESEFAINFYGLGEKFGEVSLHVYYVFVFFSNRQALLVTDTVERLDYMVPFEFLINCSLLGLLLSQALDSTNGIWRH